MTVQSIVCGSCANEVPYGRLSCPSCGELLASVTGSRRSSALARPAVPDVLYDAGNGPSAAVVDGQLAQERPYQEPVMRDTESELPWAASATHGPSDLDVAADGEATEDDDDDPAAIDGHDGRSSTAGPAWAVGTA